nr:uncharacterized protein LOC106838755 isoform X2 [Equus asinus]
MTGKGEKQKGDETQLQGKGVCARPPRLCSGGRPGASSHLGTRIAPLAVAVACAGPTPAANALRSCQLGPSSSPPLAGPPQSSRSRSGTGRPFWVPCSRWLKRQCVWELCHVFRFVHCGVILPTWQRLQVPPVFKVTQKNILLLS